jgi:hypothetical protein
MLGQRFEAGQFITFVYNPPPPPPPRVRPARVENQRQPDGSLKQVVIPARVPPPPPPPSDRNKEVFVLHPAWHGKLHALDMGHLTPAEGQIVRAMMDPEVKAQIDAGKWPVEGAPPYPLLRDILHRSNPVELIKNPLAFYQQLIKPFIRQSDAYRQYWPQYVSNVRVVQESKVQGHVMNVKPLFHK